LKNRPKVEAQELCNTIDAPFDYHEAVSKWFQGFKAELKKEPPITWIKGVAYVKVKEILGESDC